MNTIAKDALRLTEAETAALARIKTAARLALGFVWVWEGLMPKMLHPSELQIEMVRRSGMWLGSPQDTLFWLGVAMVAAGLAIMTGIKERLSILLSTVSVAALIVLVVATNPEAIFDPYGGLAKDACLFVCAALVWFWPAESR